MEQKLISNNINKNVLKTHLSFLKSHIESAGKLEFKMLPFQKYDEKTFNPKYWKKFSSNVEEHIDFIGSYYVFSDFGNCVYHNGNVYNKSKRINGTMLKDICDEAHIIFKLKNGYWIYMYLYSLISGLEDWGCDNVISYASLDIEQLVKYGIANKYHKKLGLV